MTDISKQIKKLRLQRRLTQVQLGKLVGVPQSAVARMEGRDGGNITVKTLYRFAKALQAEVILIPWSV